MTKTLEAVFDGEVFRPDEPPELSPDTRVRITIEDVDKSSTEPTSFLKTARTLSLKGPSDWSARFEEYLYSKESEDGE